MAKIKPHQIDWGATGEIEFLSVPTNAHGVIIRVPEGTTEEQQVRIAKGFRQAFPDLRAILMPKSIEIQAVRKHEWDLFIKESEKSDAELAAGR